MTRKEVQKAFVLCVRGICKVVIEAVCQQCWGVYAIHQSCFDSITSEKLAPDEQLMRSIEEQIGVRKMLKKRSRFLMISLIMEEGLWLCVAWSTWFEGKPLKRNCCWSEGISSKITTSVDHRIRTIEKSAQCYGSSRNRRGMLPGCCCEVVQGMDLTNR